MKNKILFPLLLSGMMVLMTGCVGTINGQSKAGIPWTKDTITKRYDRPKAQSEAATKTVLAREGKLTIDYISDNTLEAQINGDTVWVRLEDVEPNVTLVSVQARRGARADIETAADIATKIALQLMAQ
jgi:hypothetical protein